ncbi:metalloendopeptidase [Elysia marginata]|uniref:Metalloendopeptidase n=1 Tax=Elysia marginata TaxID=1093978 RepID=A0AAV4GG59_9GAST|nr:metalloendopeptidase [Elysia marginata]
MKTLLLGLLLLFVIECRTKDLRQRKQELEPETTIDPLILEELSARDFDHLTWAGRKPELGELDTTLKDDQWKTNQDDVQPSQAERLSREKRKAVRNMRYRWFDKTIPFDISPDINDWDDIFTIFEAVLRWENYTCLRFPVREKVHVNYVYFQSHSDSCDSNVGMVGGRQVINLTPLCRRLVGAILHEIGHALGFYHEQDRPDRDDHVDIIWKNLPDGWPKSILAKEDDKVINSYGLPYDYNSIMHYSGEWQGKRYMQTKDKEFQDKIGNVEQLSFYDIKLANLMYSCSESCAPGIVCPGEGYLAEDCLCYCPGDPVQLCDTTTDNIEDSVNLTSNNSRNYPDTRTNMQQQMA